MLRVTLTSPTLLQPPKPRPKRVEHRSKTLALALRTRPQDACVACPVRYSVQGRRTEASPLLLDSCGDTLHTSFPLCFVNTSGHQATGHSPSTGLCRLSGDVLQPSARLPLCASVSPSGKCGQEARLSSQAVQGVNRVYKHLGQLG